MHWAHRSLRLTTSDMTIWAMLIMPPPPAPATPRKMINCVIDLESPAAKHPTIYILMAAQRPALRPNMSLSRPHSGWKAVEVSRYADGTHDETDPALKYEVIVGKAVAVIVASRLDTRIHQQNSDFAWHNLKRLWRVLNHFRQN